MDARTGEDVAYLDHPVNTAAAMATLALPVAAWFRERFGEPTPIQRLAWPALATNRHLLLSAPTGTGKTLAAFLPILNRLLDPDTAGANTPSVRCLYVAPLKALVHDAARNLERTLQELAPELPPPVSWPGLAVRTGDTPAAERQQLHRQPPDILLTTPESLAILLSQAAWQEPFAGLRWVVVDEIHSLAAGKRGADLALSLERLTRLAAGPVQRVGLSATATPLAEAARYLGGVGRPCTVARVTHATPMRLTLEPLEGGPGFLANLVARLVPALREARTTLVFTNTRRLAERLAWTLRRRLPDWDGQVAVHHSAVAAGRRREVEGRLKQGQLRAVVSSTSLELGIDIGAIDQVVLVHPPGDVVRLMQRVGRAGHGPDRVRRALVLTAGASELLEAAVTGASGRAGQCEPLAVPAHPLDVLCQQLAGMAAAGPWSADEVFGLVRQAYPYRDLSREDFDDCLAYLRGLDREGRDWLPARLRGGGGTFTIRDPGTARLLRRNLGTILAEPTYEVRLRQPGPAESEADFGPADVLIGQVDEAFGERLQPGDRFLLDGRCLEFRRREWSALVVEEVAGRPVVPRWGGEGWPLSTELARRLFVLRVQAAEALREGPVALAELLRRDYGIEDPALPPLVDYFQRQESLSEIPDTSTCLIECVDTGGGTDYYLHTPLNRLANDALARVLVHRLARSRGRCANSIVADLGLALVVRGAPLDDMPQGLRRLLDADGFEADLEASLAESIALRERFQRVALTGLMLLRNPLGRRRRVGGPDWGERRLFDQVRARDEKFVLLRQAAREVRAHLCDGSAAFDYVRQFARLSLRCRWLARPSPFAESWTQSGPGPAEAIETPAEALERLHAALMGGQAHARPH